ncbi:pilus assembly protein TadC [Pseudorhizobium tarimense]|uniref:Pilus assembly protein TadC n=1 Tax=Pseudorhizobium tarimense TaxID=1079109 RepID=A0ABV2HB21_9HYPH|nr:hypothetical protein [Pseudorhizobium tarimense]MCJ8520662.1 hypothetical protein [Pseudorhizobium tarimense]
MEKIRTETYLTVIASLMVNAVVFGVGAIAILSIPAVEHYVRFLLPAWIAISLVIAPFIAFKIAPRMRLRYWRDQDRVHI